MRELTSAQTTTAGLRDGGEVAAWNRTTARKAGMRRRTLTLAFGEPDHGLWRATV